MFRMISRRCNLSAGAFACAGIVSGCGGPAPTDVALGTLERDRIELTAEAREPIVEMTVREGAHVKAGDLLLRLDDATIRTRLDQARDALNQAESQRRELEVSAARLTVRALVDAIVESLPYKLGERPPMGNPVVVLLKYREPYARVYVPEPLRAQVAAGTLADIRVDGV